MSKSAKNAALVFIGSALFWYLVGAFVSLEWNTFQWDEASRAFYVFIVCASLLFSWSAAHD